MRSIQRSLTLWVLLGVGAAALVAAIAFYTSVRRGMVREFDRALVAKARALGSLLVFDDGEVELDFADEVMPEFERDQDPEFFQVWLGDRRSLERSRTLEGRDLPLRSGPIEAPLTWDLELPDGRAGRAVGLHLGVRSDEEGEEEEEREAGHREEEHRAGEGAIAEAQRTATVVVARSRAELDASLGMLVTAMCVAGLLAGLAIVLIVALAVRRGLRPLRGLASEVERIDARTLSQRLSPSEPPRELVPLVSKLNELLGRMEAAFARERRMTANVAHELRTPIAELRAAADVARKWPDDPALQGDAVDAAHSVARHMGEVVDGLLRLSRVQAGRETLHMESVDLSALVEGLWSSFTDRARERELQVTRRTEPGATLRSDRQLLTLVLRNLLDNAVSHSPRGGSIVVESAVSNGNVALTLTNAPVDLDAADLELLGEPFWQKDAARPTGEHRGLGLTLSRAVAEVLQASLAFSVVGRSFTATFAAPRDLG